MVDLPLGVKGAQPGARGTKLLKRADGSEEILTSKCDRIQVKEGDLLLYNTWGGGGVGDPLTREAERVLADIEAGLVSVDGAADNYGVIIANGAIDMAATQKRRAEMADARGDDLPLFNFGGDIETLRANCEAETGIAAPKDPKEMLKAAAE